MRFDNSVAYKGLVSALILIATAFYPPASLAQSAIPIDEGSIVGVVYGQYPNQTQEISATSAAPVVRVVNARGQPLAGFPVRFWVADSGWTARFNGATSYATTTDNNGLARAPKPLPTVFDQVNYHDIQGTASPYNINVSFGVEEVVRTRLIGIIAARPVVSSFGCVFEQIPPGYVFPTSISIVDRGNGNLDVATNTPSGIYCVVLLDGNQVIHRFDEIIGRQSWATSTLGPGRHSLQARYLGSCTLGATDSNILSVELPQIAKSVAVMDDGKLLLLLVMLVVAISRSRLRSRSSA
jgi:hypothetical protein